MKGGHNVRSTAQKLILGTTRPDRDAARLENHTPALKTIPMPPDFFDDRHREKWYQTAKTLLQSGILAAPDFDGLVLYTQTWVIAEDAYKDVSINGPTLWIVSPRGTKKPIKNPAYNVYMEAQRTLTQLLQQFGFTPQSRQRIKVSPPQKQDDIFDMLMAN